MEREDGVGTSAKLAWCSGPSRPSTPHGTNPFCEGARQRWGETHPALSPAPSPLCDGILHRCEIGRPRRDICVRAEIEPFSIRVARRLCYAAPVFFGWRGRAPGAETGRSGDFENSSLVNKLTHSSGAFRATTQRWPEHATRQQHGTGPTFTHTHRRS